MVANKVKATPAARNQARKDNIKLDKLIGSGENGRIHLVDVLNYLKDNKTNTTPLARRIAEDLNIDLETIVGTGYNGKIRKCDLEKVKAPETIISTNTSKVSDIKETKSKNENSSVFNTVEGEFEKPNPMRATVAKRMSESYFSAPVFTFNIEVDATELKSLRAKLIDTVKESVGVKLTMTDLIVMAVSRILPNHQALNSAWTDEGIFRYKDINIAIAVGLDEGLYVPVVKSVNKKSLKEIAKESKELAEKVKTGKLMPADQEGNTFTISNVGMYGITTFTPIINMPSSAILGVGATQDKFVPVNGEPKIKPIMNLSLTSDHRVIDGTVAAKFLKDLKELLENPLSMLV
ncbi:MULTISPECIES: 2-oxo acid dehydrogenase subunit E2 [unclassified Clostridioides]|uniref:2-oxo acid dehydrogenase subunit E2 n=1 Tax=unclassified Clostridioides TaxID=2635829 RepID=UPI001D11D5A9|nr:2-oxo acid dehydrogenase subunit E2 [Clostridioides sp. ES-S-0171-01]MCC0688573.1 2-oxo acid dehydrogenase subunit E2 [Clostridioides sp. ES-S-0056-01]MCC0716315.1 2-oxo acid dehydrogenase subunit E2 [Clostridioides sp. ES-S-0077-01]UDN54752.1 2-oxo acid dehydrogenase subunit E2 [Clostridioides sp. ES-S-0054-01]